VSKTAVDIAAPVPPHRPCKDLERLSDGVADDVVHRLVLGQDQAPVRLTADEVEDLGDPFARLLLANGVFPRTAGEVLERLASAVPDGDPLQTHQFFVVGEGTQIPSGSAVIERNLRFVVSVGEGPGGADIVMSAPHPESGFAEVMAWDGSRGGFNYYRTVGESSAWVFAGNSRHALTGPTRDQGPFESHKSGHVLMKELRLPWVHWDSPTARVGLSIFAEQNLLDHPWVKRLAPGGAYTLEEAVAIPSMQRWTKVRLDSLMAGDADETPRRLLEQVLTTPTVNLESSNTSSAAALSGAQRKVDLPDTFFVDSAALSGILQLPRPPQPFVTSAIYAASIDKFNVRLTDGAQFSQPGDTHFAFVVPERSFEDTETLGQAVKRGILSKRLAACLLTVDFPNPIFSARRERLLRHVPDGPLDAAADFSQSIAEAILSSPEASQRGTPEAEFKERWDVGEDFAAHFSQLLTNYYAAFSERLGTQEGFDNYMELAESRRARVNAMPIAESPMLFSQSDIDPLPRRMRANGTVEVVK
jgi:hypothetical protein